MMARDIEVKYIRCYVDDSSDIGEEVNEWLRRNSDKDIIDIKFGGQGDYNSGATALIIYEKL